MIGLILLWIAGVFSIDVLDQVDLFYGTENGGHMFPGITRPFGMCKIGVDVINSHYGDAYSGYAPDGQINGISMMHESGTGGAPEYGVVSQLPFSGDFNANTEITLTRTSDDIAKIGLYQVNTTNVDIEFTASERSGFLKYNYKNDSQIPKILVNVSHHLSAPSRPWWTQYFVNGSISSESNGYTGHTTIKGGWGLQQPWTIYFCGKFNQNITKVNSFKGGEVGENSSAQSSTQDDSVGLVFEFDNSIKEIQSQVGISFISTSQACENIDTNDDFYSLVKDTQNKWSDEVFDKFEIQSDNNTLISQFYTNLYGCHLLPSNRTGENPYWSDQPTYYDDFFTIWDTFRTLNPLINIINPTRGGEIIEALINIYKNDGWTPDGRSANQNGRVQGGTNSDIVMADAFVKNISHSGNDWNDAYSAMVKNAEVQPPYWYDSKAPDASTKQGRGALPDWLQYGYITRNYTRSVSRTVEYSYDDFALSVVAQKLGHSQDYQKYLNRSTHWQNIWNHQATAEGKNYTGFLQPRNSNGEFNFTNYNPLSCGGCYWGDDEYEGKPVEYGWSVPFDIATLKSFIGNDQTFIQRLNDMYELHGSNVADVGNEPSFTTPYLFNYVNQQYRTVELVRFIVDKYFKSGMNGLPGNSDGGAMQSWLVFALMGIYPIAGTTTYLISSPFLNDLKLTLENGKVFEIKSYNLSNENIYVSSLKINGLDWNQNWVDHESIFTNGGLIEFYMTSEQKLWESGTEPPSPGHIS